MLSNHSVNLVQLIAVAFIIATCALAGPVFAEVQVEDRLSTRAQQTRQWVPETFLDLPRVEIRQTDGSVSPAKRPSTEARFGNADQQIAIVIVDNPESRVDELKLNPVIHQGKHLKDAQITYRHDNLVRIELFSWPTHNRLVAIYRFPNQQVVAIQADGAQAINRVQKMSTKRLGALSRL